jgi:glucosamine--fructose-6-phosphate aminotransferase (isomerizing)
MCGIVGYVGSREARPLLLSGLQMLEYRGYDSAGIAVMNGAGVHTVRAIGNLAALRAAVVADDATGAAGTGADGAQTAGAVAETAPHTGLGHTRWATHGRVTVANAHPHCDHLGRAHIVMNGIVENYVVLKEELAAAGDVFSSDTDAEVIAHLIAKYDAGDFVEAVRKAYLRLEGHYAFVAMGSEHPGLLVGVRKECPLLVGRGDGEQFIGSAVPAFLSETRDVQYMNNDELAVLRPDSVQFLTIDGTPLEREITHVDWDIDTAERGGYETFMLKEINEQDDAVADTLGERIASGETIDLGDLGAIDAELLRKVRRVVIVACGTAYHAGLIGRYAIEEWARMPVEVEVASEYRYRNPIVGPDDLVIGISQSGETADTLAALRGARAEGAKILAVTNVMGSLITRESDGVLYTRAGIEIGVAATKTFVAQVVAMYLLALHLAELRGTIAPSDLRTLIDGLKQLPRLIGELLASVTEPVHTIADSVADAEFFMYLGRHIGLPIALEGALKLKEISYTATDSYAAGEMKHGPIALLDESTPVVVVATDSPVLEKLISNVQEVRARGARVIAIATEGDHRIDAHADEVVRVPVTPWMLAPALAVIPLQLFAYFIASKRGLNIDQPRNLAKTVTVE